jgi:hypothetical protein
VNQRTGKLKSKKPYPKVNFKQADALLHASANYMWRMLAFDMCNFRPHNSLPCTADWDLRQAYKHTPTGMSEWMDTLDDAIRQVESTIPVDQHKGALEWGYALGLMNPDKQKDHYEQHNRT